MPNCNRSRKYGHNEFSVEVLAKLEAEYLRRRGETIVDLLYGMEKLSRLRGEVASCASVQTMGRRG